MYIPDDLVEEIRSRNDIVDIVSSTKSSGIYINTSDITYSMRQAYIFF